MEALNQIHLTQQLNLARHTPCRMSHEQQSAQLMTFCLQELSPIRRRELARQQSGEIGPTEAMSSQYTWLLDVG
jgi:hypothetical protein